jgi:hypothetical protein
MAVEVMFLALGVLAIKAAGASCDCLRRRADGNPARAADGPASPGKTPLM